MEEFIVNKFKKLIASVVALSFVLSVPISVGAESLGSVKLESRNDYINVETPEDYIAYLKQSQAVSLFSNNPIEAADTNEYLKQFMELPEDKQQRFVDYINDPEFIKTALTALSEQTEGTQTFYNGDLVVRSSLVEVKPTSTIAPFAVGDTSDYSWYHEAITDLMGLDFVKTRAELKIRVTQVATNLSAVTDVLDSGGVLVQNFIPMAHIAKEEKKIDIPGDRSSAKFTVDWSWNFVHKVLGVQVGTKRQWVQITKANVGTGGINNL